MPGLQGPAHVDKDRRLGGSAAKYSPQIRQIPSLGSAEPSGDQLLSADEHGPN